MYSIQHYVIKFVSFLWQVGSFLQEFCFLHQWKWPPQYNWNIVESGVRHHKAKPNPVWHNEGEFLSFMLWNPRWPTLYFCIRWYWNYITRLLVRSCKLDRTQTVHWMDLSQLGPPLSWSYGNWIYNYLCNQCLWSLCDKVCHWLATGQWFTPDTLVSSTI